MGDPTLAPPRTCRNCAHYDADGDCLALIDTPLPMWVPMLVAIEPMDAGAEADECEAWRND